MSLIWKVGLIIVSTFQGGGEGSDELMQVKSLIVQLGAAAEPRVSCKSHYGATEQLLPVRSPRERRPLTGVQLHILAATWRPLSIYGENSLVLVCPGSRQGSEAVCMTQGPSPLLPPPGRGTRSWARTPPPRDLAALSRHWACPGGKFGLVAWVGEGPPAQTVGEG